MDLPCATIFGPHICMVVVAVAVNVSDAIVVFADNGGTRAPARKLFRPGRARAVLL